MSNISKKIILNQLEYPVKVLLAWGEAIDGKNEFRDFLMKSPYRELGIFCFALLNDRKSRKWLVKNNYGHLLATIEGVEGKDSALIWLKKNGFDTLFHFARSADSWNKRNQKVQRSEVNFSNINKETLVFMASALSKCERKDNL